MENVRSCKHLDIFFSFFYNQLKQLTLHLPYAFSHGVPRGELPDGPLAHLQLLAARLVDLPEPRLLRSSFTQDCLMKRPDGQGQSSTGKTARRLYNLS